MLYIKHVNVDVNSHEAKLASQYSDTWHIFFSPESLIHFNTFPYLAHGVQTINTCRANIGDISLRYSTTGTT